MKIVLYSKPLVQSYLRPTTKLLAKMGVTANQVTVTNILVSLITGIMVLIYADKLWPLFLIPCALIVRFVLNHIDGMLAREHDMKTSLGEILNELSDIISDVALYLPLAIVEGISPVLIVAIVVLAMITEIIGILGKSVGAERRMDGPLGKRPRGVALGTLAFLLALGVTPGMWSNILLLSMLPLLVFTSIRRANAAIDQTYVWCQTQ